MRKSIKQWRLPCQPACGDAELATFQKRVQQIFGVSLPAEYVELLSIVNGWHNNGLTIYATTRGTLAGTANLMMDGLVEANSEFREVDLMSNYLVLGEDGTVFFAQDLRSGRFVVCLIVGLTELESYATCGELFVDALTAHP
jgi:hypothetical protein